MVESVIFPVNYESIVNKVMKLNIIENYGHPILCDQDIEFDESRGYEVMVYGWTMFCDEVGPFEDIYVSGFKIHICGNLYDTENGLGYIGYIAKIDNKYYPVIYEWAERTRIKYPGQEKFSINKFDAYYYYESLDMC